MQHINYSAPPHSPSGWNALLNPRNISPALSGELSFDWLIIGAGFAGLAAAKRLAELRPQASIAIVEADVVGENASGKNSGFAIDLPHFSDNNVASAASARAEIALYRRTIAELEQAVHQHGIACDWQQTGRYHAAVSSKLGRQLLDHYRRNLSLWQETWRDCQLADLQAELGSNYYQAAVFTAGTYLLNPAALVRGLADNLPPNVRLFERSAVLSFDFSGENKRVQTPQGSIISGGVIIAVNAFLQHFGIHRLRQVPMILYATLTEPLNDAQMAQLGSVQNWGITPAHGTVGATLRLTADRRLFIRHGFHYSPKLNESPRHLSGIQQQHLQMLNARFPQLTLQAAHTWQGWLAISHNHQPLFGQAGQNVFVVSCCNGAGVVRHSAAGKLIAEQALGIENPDIATYLASGQASLLPPRPFLDLGIHITAAWQKWRGRSEI